ncbi:MAG: helix-turn-helix transcriptional regulator [Ruminococcaceae bacterium]|nr:helix-turn-helix transcriptional regulator [Oscillospiraceae bacterium]
MLSVYSHGRLFSMDKTIKKLYFYITVQNAVDIEVKTVYNTAKGEMNMKILSPDRLYTENFRMGNIFSMHQSWDPGHEFSMLSHDRPTNAFLYFSSGSAKYVSARENGEVLLEVSAGAFVFIPKGSRYLIHFDERVRTRTELFEFTLFDTEDREFTIGKRIECLFEDGEFLSFDINRLADSFRLPVLSPTLINSVAYGIMYLVSENTSREGMLSTGIGLIEKSIRMIETSPDNDMTVGELAKLSNVSIGTFNSLFHEYCGMSPGAYRNRLKLTRAKKLLSDSYISVSETAQTLGFNDTGYFCRWFKKNCGMTASQYAKKHKK